MKKGIRIEAEDSLERQQNFFQMMGSSILPRERFVVG